MRNTIFFSFLLLFLTACPNPKPFSPIPHIEFDNIELIKKVGQIDSLVRLTFSFQDGDGDIGLNSNDTLPPFGATDEYHYNFFADYYEKQNGVFVKFDDTDNLFNKRIPRLSNRPTEPIEGTVSLNLDFNPFSKFDTIYYSFYIVDRTLNKSNIVKTPEIIIRKK